MPSLAAANMSFRREVYEQAGGFDPNYRGHGFRFETDFSFALRKTGRRIRFVPGASLVHRYGSPGGAENVHLGRLTPESREWLVVFFANTFYFLRKWHGLRRRIPAAVAVWREQAMNRAVLAQGWKTALVRQRAFLEGLRMAGRMRDPRSGNANMEP